MAEPFSSAPVDPPISESEAQTLRAQIRKWQERMPRLATALRVRSEALAAARNEIRQLKQGGRSERPAEQRCAMLESELAATRAGAQKEMASLTKRNRQLFSTLQITNTQLERIGEQIRGLHGQLDSRDALIDQLRDQLTQLQRAQHQTDLTRIRGIGVKLAAQLQQAGIDSIEALAGLDPNQIDDADHPLHLHAGRMRRDRWLEQAASLVQIHHAQQGAAS